MKKLLITMTLAFGLVLFSMPAFTDSDGTSRVSGEAPTEIPPNANRACPDCSGDAPIITGVTFQTGTDCICSGATSLTIGPDVTVETGAAVSFRSTKISIRSGTTIEPGATVDMMWIKEPVSIDLTRDPTSIAADGSSYSIITAEFKDADGNPVLKGTSVNFTTDLGTFPDGSQDYTISTYDETGIVTVFLHAGITPGTATVTATLGATSEQVQVTIYSKEPAEIVLEADPSTLNADGTGTSTVRASVTDATGSPVTDGTSIAFSMTVGTGSLSAASAVTAGGIATVTYTASTTAGIETVKAEASNGVTDTFDITLMGTPDPADFALSTSQTTIKSDNSETATITATVVDGNNASFPGATVSFSSDGGQLSASSAVTDDTGQASITISSGSINKSNRVITITATIANLGSETIPVQVIGSTLEKTTDKTTITDDNTTVAELTLTAKDAGGIAVFNTQITFSFGPDDTGTATITPVNPATYPYTDVSGQLKVIVTGVTAGSVTVIAGGLGTTATQAYTVSAVGTEFAVVSPSSDPFSASIRNVATLATTPNNISIAFVDGDPDTITRSDGNSFIVDGYVAGDTIMVGGSTHNDGAYTVQTVIADTLTLANTDTLTPEGAGETVTITNGVLVRVRAFDQTQVSFSTTIGVWDGGVSAVTAKAVPASGYVWSVLTADAAGSATVQVYDTDNTAVSDSTTVVFSAPSVDAAKLNLQANTYVLAPSTGDIKNTATLTATVRSALGQVVGNAPVVFSINNTTGGGETVSPVVVLTDSSGVANTTFTSGSLSTGAEGVEITATVLNEGQTVKNTSISFSDNYPSPCTISRSDGGSFIADGFESGEEIRVAGSLVNDGYYIIASVTALTLTLHGEERLNEEPAGAEVTITAVTGSINITIGGTPGSVVIGRGSTVYEVDDATYRLPMSVLVADSNGNPVPGALVSLSAWPAQYSSGVWYDRNPNGTVRNFDTYFTRTSINEDINENMILDPGEDTNGDGELTPRNSAAGDVPTTVTTDANGVATFDLVYLKNSAVWIYDRIRASTEVLGTEITSSVEFRLPYIATEGKAGDLPDSSYPISLVTDTTTPVSVTFPQFGVDTIDNPDTFSTTDPLPAGISNVVDHKYTYDPTGGTPAKVGDTILDWITAKGSSYDWSSTANDDETAYFQVRIAVKYGNAAGSIIDLSANPGEIPADGVGTSAITASVTNSQGGVVADGTRVDFTTDLGILSAASALTVNGVATVTLTSGTVTGTATLTANTVDGATDTTTVNFVPGAVSSVSVAAVPDKVEAGGSGTSTIEARATDANGNPVSDETITFTAVSGTLSPSSRKTDDNGSATVTYTPPGSVPPGGTDTITATSTNGTSGTKDIEIISVPVGTVTVTSGSGTIVADGSSGTIIRAKVTDTNGNNIPDGTVVTFTTTAGILSAASAQTVNGTASVTLTSPVIVGSATVFGTCGGVSDSTTVTFVPGAVGALSLSANPGSIPADGASTSGIRAFATDINGNTVADGTVIRFRVTTGTGILSSSTATTTDGVATVTYTASATAGVEVVTADTANGTSDTVNVTLMAAPVGSVVVDAGSDSITADGSADTWISATVKDINDNPVPDGTNVAFTTTSGSLSAASATTTNGVATVTLTSAVSSGTATVTATAGGVNGTKDVNFVAGPVTGVAVTADPANLTADGTSTSTIRATVTDTNGNRVSDETVRFSAVSGVLSALTAVTDVNGEATVTYTAPGAVPAGNTDTITARSANNTTGTATITLIAANVGSVAVTSGSSWLFADGTSGTLITATVKDVNGNAVSDGTLVSFTTSAGSLASATATTVNGKAAVTLTSATLLGKAKVVAVSGGVNATVEVDFVAGSINAVTVLADPDNVTADGVSTSTITGTAKDANNNPVSGETLTFTVVSGDLSAATAVTDANGEATVTYTAPGAVPGGGTDTVTVTSTNGTTGSDTITLVDAIVGDVKATAGSESLIANGTSSTLISATVKDLNGNAVANGTTVSFATTAGTLSAASATTTNGVATVNLISATSLGTATVDVTCGGVNDTVKVSFVAGPVDTVSVLADPDNVTADGVSSSTITGTATDANNNPVSGETLSFTVVSGDLSAVTAVTNVNGEATVTYTAPDSVPGGGTDTVTVTSTNGTTGSDTITLIDALVGNIQVATGSGSIPADGVSTTLISATVTDINGNTVADGTTVSFSTTAGTLTAATDNTINGVATVTLTSATSLGTATVIATSGGVNDTVKVTFTAGPIDTVAVLAAPDNLTADGVSSSSITGTAKDANGNPVSGETLSFTVVSGDLSAVTAVTNVNGEATVTYTAPNAVPGGGTDTVTATATSGTTGNDTITLVAATVGSVAVTAGSPSLVADGAASTLIAATIRDSNGNIIADGTAVNFTTTAGTLSAAVAVTVNGVASVALISGTSLGTATVTATTGGISNTVSVLFMAGPPSRVTVTADPSNLTADGTSQSSVRVVVRDAEGNPVKDGTTVTFNVDYGTLDILTGSTTNGALSITYTAPSSVPAGDTATVTAETVNGAQGTASINLIGAQIATITLSANPESLPADGTTTATISATLTVVGGGSPPDGTNVSFSVVRGGGSITSTATTADGVASATLTAGNVAETATIQAEAGGRTAQIEVDYTPGSVTMAIVPNALLGTGEETATVTVQLKEADGTPAGDGETVRFTLSDESLGDIPATAVTAGGEGEAEVTFSAASKGGTVTVTGTWNTGGVDVGGTAQITIYPPPAFIQVAEGYPDPTAINVKGTGGQSTSQIVFDVKDSFGQLVADGYRIDFSILSGPNGGEAISPILATTTGGKVGTILTGGSKSGPVSIKGSYFHDTNVTTTTGDIAIVSGPPVGEAFGIYVQYVNVSGLWKMGLQNAVTVNAGDIYGNAVPDNTAISFKTYNTGGLFNPGSDGTSGGLANSNLGSVESPSPIQGFVSITGEAINGGRTTHVTSLAVGSPGSTNIVYAGTDGGGVYKSIDNGVTWNNISSSSDVPGQNWIDPYVNDVAIDPENNNTVFAATGYLGNGHLYRSFDGGSSWNSNNSEEYRGVFPSSDPNDPSYGVDSAVLSVLCDEAGTGVWIGTQGNGVFYTADGTATPRITWLQANDLGNGTEVRDVVKVAGTNVLYAATATGVFRSNDGGANWTDMSSFAGDDINTLALHPDSDGTTDIIYAGTNDAGVYVSTDTGATWTPHNDGLGKGLSASTPVPATQNKGTGVMSRVTVGDDALSEIWTITCKSAAAGGGTFSVHGTVSGDQPDYDISGGAYTIAGVLEFTITAGATDFVVGDEFEFITTRDPGLGIKDLLVDEGNRRLYAVTYFFGSLEPHAVGNVYTVGLDDPGTLAPTGNWAEAVDGLPQYDPPDDTTLFAQHAMASDIPPYAVGSPSALYIGGEGINLYKATSDLPAGDPQWQRSDSGLTNRIMARMPVLFSGVCGMSIAETPIGGGLYRYTVYIEDSKGNPPISGSQFTVTTHDVDGGLLRTVKSVTYPDTYTYEGTFRDPSDATTDDPYVVDISFTGAVAQAKFSFTPTCEDVAPGCSGKGEQLTSYEH